MKLRLLRSVGEVSREAWDALLSPNSSPFLTWDWLHAMEESGAASVEAGWLPHHLALEEDGRLVAVSPVYAKAHSQGEFVFDWSWAEAAERAGIPYYPKLVSAVPFTPATGERVLTFAGEARSARVAELASALGAVSREVGSSGAHALFVPEGDVATYEGQGFALRLGVQYQFHNPGLRDFADFVAAQPSKKRTMIRRERERARAHGLEISTLEPAELDEAMASAIHRLYLTTVDKFVWGRRYLNARFFELVFRAMPERLPIVVARRSGEVVACAFNVECGGALYGRYWGAHEELPFLHFELCFYQGIERTILRGLDRFEPGAGGEHKRARGFTPTVTRSMHLLHDPRLHDAVSRFLERERGAIEAELRCPGE